MVVSCGDGSSTDSPLSAQERSRVQGALVAVNEYCRQLGRYFSRRGSAPTNSATAAAREGVDEITALAGEKPAVEYRPGQTLRELIADTAENLEGSNCTGPLLTRLEQALASLPPEP